MEKNNDRKLPLKSLQPKITARSFKSENIFPSIIPHKNINAKLRSIKPNPF